MKNNIEKQTKNLIKHRYHRNLEQTLQDVYDLKQEFTYAQQEEINFAYENSRSIAALLHDPQQFNAFVHLFSDLTTHFTINHNQFLPITPQIQSALFSIYQDYVVQIRDLLEAESSLIEFSNQYQQLLNHHFKVLKDQLTRLQAPFPSNNLLKTNIVCAEYQVQFQLNLLGINPYQLKHPVLDVGCGYEANLPLFLNQIGIPCLGIDRFCIESPYTKTEDWLSFDDPPQTWGTIISHMAFSHHFRFHHFNPDGNPQAYALVYRKYLDSLIPGGAFYYTPDLPFIENLLPKKSFLITQTPIAGQPGFFVSKITRLN